MYSDDAFDLTLTKRESNAYFLVYPFKKYKYILILV